jgi:hypothetical protein
METNNLATALAKAQGAMGIAKKSGENPGFLKGGMPSKFSTFEDIVECIKEPLKANGLSYSQFTDTTDDLDYLVTKLMHGSSQEEIGGRVRIRLANPNDIHKFGGAKSYLKRYELASICGVACGDDDDDGNSISLPLKPEPVKTYQKPIETNGNSPSQSTYQGNRENASMSPNQYNLIRKHLNGELQREQEICQRIGTSSLETTSWKWVNSILVELGVEQPNKFYKPLPPLRKQQTASGYAQDALKSLINNQNQQSNISDVVVEAETEIEYEEVLPF